MMLEKHESEASHMIQAVDLVLIASVSTKLWYRMFCADEQMHPWKAESLCFLILQESSCTHKDNLGYFQYFVLVKNTENPNQIFMCDSRCLWFGNINTLDSPTSWQCTGYDEETLVFTFYYIAKFSVLCTDEGCFRTVETISQYRLLQYSLQTGCDHISSLN